MTEELGLAQPSGYAERERRHRHPRGRARHGRLAGRTRTQSRGPLDRQAQLRAGLAGSFGTGGTLDPHAERDRGADPHRHGRAGRRGAVLRRDQQRRLWRSAGGYGGGRPNGRQLRNGRSLISLESVRVSGRAQSGGQGAVRRACRAEVDSILDGPGTKSGRSWQPGPIWWRRCGMLCSNGRSWSVRRSSPYSKGPRRPWPVTPSRPLRPPARPPPSSICVRTRGHAAPAARQRERKGTQEKRRRVPAAANSRHYGRLNERTFVAVLACGRGCPRGGLA